MMVVRQLDVVDVEAFRALRTRALTAHPEAFYSTIAEERSREEIERQLRDRPAGAAVFGGFLGAALVGMVGVRRETFTKGAHKGQIWGMYVDSEVRRQHLGRDLLRRAVQHVRGLGGVTLVQLSLTVGNHAARALYVAEGFVRWGIEKDALRVDGASFDEEHMVLHF